MTAQSRHPSSRRARAPRSRAFTLLEVTLAAVLGAMIVFSCLALFGAIERAQRRHELRVAQTNDFTRAYQVIERSFRLLVMAEQDNATDADTERRIERDLERSRGTILEDEPLENQTTRFELEPDNLPELGARIGSTAGRGGSFGGLGLMEYENQQVSPQVLRLALRAPPVAGGFASQNTNTESGVMLQVVDERERAREALERSRAQRAAERQTRRTEGSSRARSTASDPQIIGGAGDVVVAAGETEEEFDASDINRPRAPGVRAEFILLPDGSAPTSSLQAATATGSQPARPDPSAQPGWTLWYREMPPRSAAFDLTPDERARALAGDTSFLSTDVDPADLALDVDPASLRVVRLVSGLKTCHWRVFRRGEFSSRITAVSARELPAYVELSLETVGGRREKWMFEVGWSQGPEPGQLLALAADPLNAPSASSDRDGDGIPDNEEEGANGEGGGGGGGGNGSGKDTTNGGGNAGGNGGPIDLGGGVKGDPTTNPVKPPPRDKVRPKTKPGTRRDGAEQPVSPTR